MATPWTPSGAKSLSEVWDVDVDVVELVCVLVTDELLPPWDLEDKKRGLPSGDLT